VPHVPPCEAKTEREERGGSEARGGKTLWRIPVTGEREIYWEGEGFRVERVFKFFIIPGRLAAPGAADLTSAGSAEKIDLPGGEKGDLREEEASEGLAKDKTPIGRGEKRKKTSTKT